MNKPTDKQIIDLLMQETVPALGCTEPVACALACAKCREELGDIPDKISVQVSGNIYKNGMGVGIPGTGMTGLPIAAALGAVCGRTIYGLEVLKDVKTGDCLNKAKQLLADKRVQVKMKADAEDKLYVEAICSKGNDSVKTVIIHSHLNIVSVEKNGEIVFSKNDDTNLQETQQRPELSLECIWRFVNEIAIEDIEFLEVGAEMNKKVSEEGLNGCYGLQIGRTLKESIDKGFLADDLLNNVLIRSTAASDARMDGCTEPVMTNSGSGNQGITVSIPVVVTAERLASSREQKLRALALSNLIAIHIHYYMGHLSALCGILIAATGAASGITYLLGGGYDNVVNTIKTMCSNLTGMVCDGAKQGCALKVYSGVSAAVQAALLSIYGIKTNNDGIVDDDIEKTIRNIGIIGVQGMEQTDKTVLEIMTGKENC
ncbi:MAG: L-serine ammonia-lyase, iron-sulfur-dependent, subunit alpha [Culturomica sp.]|jgi:L-cysteine desulfidase|nr:L-serine ammonia-lyase, iron-sulfur-dependent, subunit alpha [Culturomica sp.]